MHELDQPTGTCPGTCHACHRYTAAAIVVAEIHADSGPGAVVLRCPACQASRHTTQLRPEHA